MSSEELILILDSPIPFGAFVNILYFPIISSQQFKNLSIKTQKGPPKRPGNTNQISLCFSYRLCNSKKTNSDTAFAPENYQPTPGELSSVFEVTCSTLMTKSSSLYRPSDWAARRTNPLAVPLSRAWGKVRPVTHPNGIR